METINLYSCKYSRSVELHLKHYHLADNMSTCILNETQKNVIEKKINDIDRRLAKVETLLGPYHIVERGELELNIQKRFGDLPFEVIVLIFSYLSPYDQQKAMCVSKHWKLIGEDETLREVREACFGKAKWNKHFGDVGLEHPLPLNIYQTLNSKCIFWPEKKVKETCLLYFIPGIAKGKDFYMDTLQEIVKNPKTGNKIQYHGYSKYVQDDIGTKSTPPHWVLMTRNVIPCSRNKTYEEQKALVASYAKKSKIPYEIPEALDIATVILMHYLETREALYTDDKLGKQWTYTRCQETVSVEGNKSPVVIGGLSSEGLFIDADWIEYDQVGVGCCWRVE